MNIFKQIKLTLRFIKFQRFLGSLFYSLQRDRLEGQFGNSRSKEPIEEPGKILRAEPTKRGGHFYFEQAELEVCFLSADLVRVEWQPGIPPIPYGISRQDWSEVETTLDKTADGWMVSSTALKVVIRVDGSLKLCNFETYGLSKQVAASLALWFQRATTRSELDFEN